jgi:hypothetical protein
MAYREIIPLRAAVSDLDTYQGSSHRSSQQYLDIFVRVMRCSDQTGAVMICYLNDLAANMTITSPASRFSLPHMLTRSPHRGCANFDEVRFFWGPWSPQTPPILRHFPLCNARSRWCQRHQSVFLQRRAS